MNLELREITRDSVRAVCGLQVRDEQRGYVASNALSLAQAHFEPGTVFRALYLDERPIGFVQWRGTNEPGTVLLWRFMIDRKHQGAGYGRAALSLSLEQMRSSGFRAVETSVVLGPASPLGFYLRQGFVEVGRTTQSGEWSLRRSLSPIADLQRREQP